MVEQVEQAGGAGLTRPSTRRLGAEVALLLALSLGQSAVYSVLAILDRLTRNVALNQQTTTMNPSVTPDRPWLDLSYQLVGVAFGVMPAVLALYLLAVWPGSPGRLIGLVRRRPGFDLALGVGIAAGVGIPGLGLYLGARSLGFNTAVQASALTDHWWTVPVLVLSALQNAVVEEVVMIGYLLTRLRALGWRIGWVLATSAIIRGCYHLYQGFGGFAGNLAMGLIFGLVYLRVRRVGPLIVAHALLDVTAFVGYDLLAGHVSWL